MVVWRGGRLRLRLEFESVSAGSGSRQGRGLVAGPLLLLLCRVRVRLPVVACETAGKLTFPSFHFPVGFKHKHTFALFGCTTFSYSRLLGCFCLGWAAQAVRLVHNSRSASLHICSAGQLPKNSRLDRRPPRSAVLAGARCNQQQPCCSAVLVGRAVA